MVCRSCSTKFAVGLHMCPQCTAEDAYMDGDENMPKITVHGGPTVAGETEGGDLSSPGNSSSTSTEKQPTSDEQNSPQDQSPAPTTESPSSTGQTADSSVPSTDGDPTAADLEVAPYEEWTNEALRDEIGRRNEVRAELGIDRLPVSGTKAELVERLEDDDTDPNRPEAPPVEQENPA